MQCLMIGLGKIGLGVSRRLLGSVELFGYDVSSHMRKTADSLGIRTLSDLSSFSSGKTPDRIFWILVPSQSVSSVLQDLNPHLRSGDIVIEGGNSDFRQSQKRAKKLSEEGVYLLDVGTSGGVHGEKDGFCLMVGGDPSAFQKAEPLFKQVASPDGYLHVGPSGAGHYVKMVHNAIEYGLLQVLGEGFWLMEGSDFSLDLERIARLWNQGSVVRGWLMNLVASALSQSSFSKIQDEIGGGETGSWALREAMTKKIPIPLISQALMERYSSIYPESFSHKLIAALRREFGGHEVKT